MNVNNYFGIQYRHMVFLTTDTWFSQKSSPFVITCCLWYNKPLINWKMGYWMDYYSFLEKIKQGDTILLECGSTVVVEEIDVENASVMFYNEDCELCEAHHGSVLGLSTEVFL